MNRQGNRLGEAAYAVRGRDQWTTTPPPSTNTCPTIAPGRPTGIQLKSYLRIDLRPRLVALVGIVSFGVPSPRRTHGGTTAAATEAARQIPSLPFVVHWCAIEH